MKLSRLAAWASILQALFTVLGAVIMLLLFVDPGSRASQWIPHIDRFHLEFALFLLFGIAIFLGLRRLSAVERSVSEVVQRLGKVDEKPVPEIYNELTPSGGHLWTRKEIDKLPDEEKANLKKRKPGLWRWYLGEPQRPLTPDEIENSEEDFRVP